jgi:hypothetical protein
MGFGNGRMGRDLSSKFKVQSSREASRPKHQAAAAALETCDLLGFLALALEVYLEL